MFKKANKLEIDEHKDGLMLAYYALRTRAEFESRQRTLWGDSGAASSHSADPAAAQATPDNMPGHVQPPVVTRTVFGVSNPLDHGQATFDVDMTRYGPGNVGNLWVLVDATGRKPQFRTGKQRNAFHACE